MNDDLLAAALFAAPWAERLCLRWNADPSVHASMASAGEIGFVLDLPDEWRTLVLSWDDDGRIDCGRTPVAAQRPEFRGALADWSAVMRGEISPAGAVLRGRLAYRGPFWFAAKYAGGFAQVVRMQRDAVDFTTREHS